MSSHQWRGGDGIRKTRIVVASGPTVTPCSVTVASWEAERDDDAEPVPRAVAPPGPPVGVHAGAVAVAGERMGHPVRAGGLERDDVLGGERAELGFERRLAVAKASKSSRRSAKSGSSIH